MGGKRAERIGGLVGETGTIEPAGAEAVAKRFARAMLARPHRRALGDRHREPLGIAGFEDQLRASQLRRSAVARVLPPTKESRARASVKETPDTGHSAVR
jgi:hypothetical protein